MAFSDTPHMTRLVDFIRQHAHKDVALEVEVKRNQISMGVVRRGRAGAKDQHLTAIHGGGINDINDVALNVMEDLAVQAVMQVSSYKDPHAEVRR